MLAVIFGGWEVLCILAVTLILVAVRRLPGLSHGLREGLFRFLNAFDQVSHDAGKNLGGILGKPAAQALTPDNQTAELYDPAVFHRAERAGHSKKRFPRWHRLWHSVLKALRTRP
jgi:Sec-independent protein translocase protein TatA